MRVLVSLPLRRRRGVTCWVQRRGRFEMAQPLAIPNGAYVAHREVGRDGHCRGECIRRGSGSRCFVLVALHRLCHHFGKALDRVDRVMSSVACNPVDRFDRLVR